MVDDFKETVFSSHNREDVHMNLQRLIVSQDLKKLEPDKIPREEKVAMKSHL